MEQAEKLKERAEMIAHNLVTYQFQQKPEVWAKYGEKGVDASIRDARYLIDCLYESVVANEPQILVGYTLWADELFRGLNLPENTMLETLQSLLVTLTNDFPDIISLESNHIEQAIQALGKGQIPMHVEWPKTPLSMEAIEYTEKLLNGDRNSALMLIDKLANTAGVSVREIYLQIFQPALYNVGQLWLQSKISVAKEHYFTAVTQQAMSMLYPKIFTTERKGLSFVAACIGNELHEIGIRMVSDFFEMEGWDTYYLGANTPAESIVKAANERNADLLGLSIALPIHRSLLKHVIEQIKPQIPKKTKIIIGGHALNQIKVDTSWFGAHAYAPDALSAVELGKSIAV
jgi:methanogenic corrinoid protein MtbC1